MVVVLKAVEEEFVPEKAGPILSSSLPEGMPTGEQPNINDWLSFET